MTEIIETEMSFASWFSQVAVLTGLNYKELYELGILKSRRWLGRINGRPHLRGFIINMWPFCRAKKKYP